MNSNPVIARAKELLTLWRVALKPCPPPKGTQFLWWSATYSQDIMNKAITTTAQRIALDQEPERVYRYVSGLARNLSEGANPGKDAQQKLAVR